MFAQLEQGRLRQTEDLEAAFRVHPSIKKGYWRVPLSTFPAKWSNRQGIHGPGVSNVQRLVSSSFVAGKFAV